MITKFDIFLESRLSDNLKKLSGEGDLFNQIKQESERDFEIERDLIKYITLKKRISNKKVRFKIEYFDIVKHNIKQRIKDRTSFKNIEEFNNIIEDMLNYLFPDNIQEMCVDGKYAVYFEEYNFTIIFGFKLNDYLNSNYNLNIITIILGYTNNGVEFTFNN